MTDGCVTNEEVNEEVAKLDVSQFIGQSLFKQQDCVDLSGRDSLRRQARLLTGAPLIKTCAGSGKFVPQQQNQNYFLYCQNVQLLSAKQKEEEEEAEECDEVQDGFVPRVLRPRRRRKQFKTGTKCGASGTSLEVDFEIEIEDETRFLPTDLLNDGSCSDDSVGPESKTSTSALAPIKRPSTNQKEAPLNSSHPHPELKHSESLRLNPSSEMKDDSFVNRFSEMSGHPLLRKTFSWASGSSDDNAFSLFPKSSDCDLLSNVRSRLLQSEAITATPPGSKESADFAKKTANIEEALKSLSIDRNENSLSRKF